MKQKIITLIILAFCTILPSMAQQHELSVNGGFGLSTLDYSYVTTLYKTGAGGQIGFGYNYFVTPNWSLRTGIDFAFYNASLSKSQYGATNQTISDVGEVFDFMYSYLNYKEELSATFLNIPVMVQFQTTGKIAFYIAGGAKIGIPVSATCRTKGDLTTKGWVADLGLIDHKIMEDMEDMGFVTNRATDKKNDFSMGVSFMLSAETGIKWELSEKFNLYTGVYFDYGLTDVNKDPVTSVRLITYQPARPAEFLYGNMTAATERMNTIAGGITIRLAYKL